MERIGINRLNPSNYDVLCWAHLSISRPFEPIEWSARLELVTDRSLAFNEIGHLASDFSLNFQPKPSYFGGQVVANRRIQSWKRTLHVSHFVVKRPWHLSVANLRVANVLAVLRLRHY